ncbi:Stress responsive alpha-beta barrel [Spatholobus suberectus]|nr:Stress responsive alpha-beta barrel [Spatholobus suberectus]
MGEFKHFVTVKFKEGVVVEELTKGMEKLVSEIDAVKSFECLFGGIIWNFNLLDLALIRIFSCTLPVGSYHMLAFILNKGQDIESLDVLRRGFTHAFLMTFNKKKDFVPFQSHPNHVEFSTTFSVAIENVVLLDFPSTLVKAPSMILKIFQQ